MKWFCFDFRIVRKSPSKYNNWTRCWKTGKCNQIYPCFSFKNWIWRITRFHRCWWREFVRFSFKWKASVHTKIILLCESTKIILLKGIYEDNSFVFPFCVKTCYAGGGFLCLSMHHTCVSKHACMHICALIRS